MSLNKVKLAKMKAANTHERSKKKIMYLLSKIKKMKIEQNALMKQLQESDEAKKSIEEELDSIKKDVGTLRKYVECPVCLEIPRKGPVYACSNGHFVCQKCKRGGNCPTCREVMGSNKSILAVSVIGIVPHDCKFDECKEQFPLKSIEEHESVCRHRVVACPRCDEKVPLSNLLEHLHFRVGRKKCCRAKAPEYVVDESGSVNYWISLSHSEKYRSIRKTYSYMGVHFALCASKTDNYWHFYIVMFESPEVCSSFNIEMEIFEYNSSSDSRVKAKLRCKPCSIDEPRHEIEDLGLSINDKLMRKMFLRENCYDFGVSFSFF